MFEQHIKREDYIHLSEKELLEYASENLTSREGVQQSDFSQHMWDYNHLVMFFRITSLSSLILAVVFLQPVLFFFAVLLFMGELLTQRLHRNTIIPLQEFAAYFHETFMKTLKERYDVHSIKLDTPTFYREWIVALMQDDTERPTATVTHHDGSVYDYHVFLHRGKQEVQFQSMVPSPEEFMKA